jgi:UDP-MurNAc hydroxylase
LGGRLADLNTIRGVPELEELEDGLLPILRSRGLDSQMVLLNQGESFDVERKVSSAPYTPIDTEEKARYVRDVLKPMKYVYELQSMPDEEELTEMLRLAQSKMLERIQKRGVRPALYDWNVCFPLRREGQWLGMSMMREGVELLSESEIQSPYLKIDLDPRLLKMILQCEAHFNNAEIGSHLRLKRDPDEYDIGLFSCLYYLHL